nr:MAG TPA: hypothetical protein [Bacteriophage sp.]
MNVSLTRKNKLKELVKERGLTNLSQTVGRAKSQISDITTGRRNMGEKLAREFERNLSLPPGFFDSDLLEEQEEMLRLQQYHMKVPLLPWESLLGENSTPQEVLMTTLKLSDKSFALKLFDTSMEPLICKGDDIIVDPSLTPRPADIVIAVVDGSYAVRKYRAKSKSSFELVPSNSDFAVINNQESEIEIKGVVVEIRKFLR